MTPETVRAAVPPVDDALATRLRHVCDEGWTLFEAFEATVREHDFHPFIPAEYEVVCDALVLHRAPGARFLEWGSATGVITIMASLLGFEASGIELDGQLVSTARAFNDRVGASARFARGSFIPAGYRWPGGQHLGEDTTGVGDSGYQQLGMALDDFDVVFGYPWKGEAPKMLDLMQQHGRRNGLLLLHDIHAGVRAYRNGREVAAGPSGG